MSDMSRKLKRLLFSSSLCSLFLLASCTTNIGPIEVYDKYGSLSDAQNALNKIDSTKAKKMIEFSEIESLKEYKTESVYLLGLCAHDPYHKEFDKHCNKLNASRSITFLKNQDYYIYISQELELDYDCEGYFAKANEYKLPDIFSNYAYEATTERYEPNELKNFNYKNNDDSLALFKDRYFVYRHKDGRDFSSEVMFSSNFDLAFVDEAIKDIETLIIKQYKQ